MSANANASSMRISDQLALSYVPRWGIVPMLRVQSVADHVFRTINIFTEICERSCLAITALDLLLVLWHDGPESMSGDIPTPFKKEISDVVTATEHRMCPWYIDPLPDAFSTRQVYDAFRAADLIEQYTWLRAWGHGPLAMRITNLINERIHDLEDLLGSSLVRSIIADIDDEQGRFGGRAEASR